MSNENPQPETLRQKLWKFLNTGLGIWLLSSVVLGLFTTGYTYYSAKIKEEKLKQKTIQKLDLEIESRLSQFLVRCKTCVKHPNDSCFSFHDSSNVLRVKALWYELKTPPSKDKYLFTLYPDYQERNLVSLVVELATLVPASEQKALREVIVTITADRVFFGVMIHEKCFLVFWQKFKQRMILQRWDTIMPYVDCGTKPFC